MVAKMMAQGKEVSETARKIAREGGGKEERRMKEDAEREVRHMFEQSMLRSRGRQEKGELVSQEEIDRMAQLAGNSRKASTVQAYVGALSRVRRCLKKKGKSDKVPFAPMDVARYVSEVAYECEQRGSTNAAILSAVAAIAWRHDQAELQSPTRVPFVRAVIAGATRQLGKGREQKSPIEEEDMRKWYRMKYIGGGKRAGDLAMLARIAMMKEGMMRFSDIESVKFGQVIVTQTDIRIFVSEAKTSKDKRDGQWVTIPAFEGQHPWEAYPLVLSLIERLGYEWGRLNEGAKRKWARRKEGRGICGQDENGDCQLYLNRVHVFVQNSTGGWGIFAVRTEGEIRKVREGFERMGPGY